MARNFKELAEKIPAHVRERARKELDAEVEAYEQGLADVRRARSLTQEQLARQLGVSQAQVSRIETQTDLYLSTLASYMEAMGGRLELVGVFEDTGATISLRVGDSAVSDEPEPVPA